jgi:hypothetical protein
VLSGSRITIRTMFGFEKVLLLKWVRNACRKFEVVELWKVEMDSNWDNSGLRL